MKYKKINLIAIAGGSASGKTTVAEKIAEENLTEEQKLEIFSNISKLKKEIKKRIKY